MLCGMGVNSWPQFGEEMEGMASLSSLLAYQDVNFSSYPLPIPSLHQNPESMQELKQKLMWTTMELESERITSKEERMLMQERINELILLLKLTTQERDEAREQVHLFHTKLAHQTAAATAAYDYSNVLSVLQPSTPPAKPTGDGRSDSESLSAAVDTFIDAATAAVSSPEFSDFHVSDSCNNNIPLQNQQQAMHVHAECNNKVNGGLPALTNFSVYDKASAAIEALAKRPLPEKGKLLQAVMDAGPLLQTLNIAGSLPQWRNPPPLQPMSIPPVVAKIQMAQNLGAKRQKC